MPVREPEPTNVKDARALSVKLTASVISEILDEVHAVPAQCKIWLG